MGLCAWEAHCRDLGLPAGEPAKIPQNRHCDVPRMGYGGNERPTPIGPDRPTLGAGAAGGAAATK